MLVNLLERRDLLEEEEDVKRYTVRFPKKMHDELLALAKSKRRSLHAEILVIIQEALDAETKEKDPKQNRYAEVNQVAA
jgi:hypothetical protein